MRPATILFSVSLVAALAGCKHEEGSASAQPASKPAASKSAPAVARIVFVDKEKCCACTRDRIDKSWKALTDVVGYPPVPDVDRIHMDSQAEKAAPYTKQRPVMVPPAIYFLDGQGKLVEMLQGEVKSEQVRKVLGTS